MNKPIYAYDVLSKKDFDWFAERIETLPSGLITARKNVIEKYGKLMGYSDWYYWKVKQQYLLDFRSYA